MTKSFLSINQSKANTSIAKSLDFFGTHTKLDGKQQETMSLPTRPVKSPITNSAVEYATLSEINQNSLFMYLLPDLATVKKDATRSHALARRLDPFPSPPTSPAPSPTPKPKSNGRNPAGISTLEALRDSKGCAGPS